MKKIFLPFFALSIAFVSCTSTGENTESTGDVLLDKITLTLNNYDAGLKPGIPLTDIVKYDAGATIYNDNPDEYESTFKDNEVTGYTYYEKRFSFSDSDSDISNLDEILLNIQYLETKDEATGEDIIIDYTPYVDFISDRLGVSHKMGSEEEGEEDRYFWDKDGFIFQLNPSWDGLAFYIAEPYEED
ncbi:MAG: hypothetical protein ACI8ZM_001047 [Crocinitomix sp.]|jgi:hypothetical protein